MERRARSAREVEDEVNEVVASPDFSAAVENFFHFLQPSSFLPKEPFAKANRHSRQPQNECTRPPRRRPPRPSHGVAPGASFRREWKGVGGSSAQRVTLSFMREPLSKRAPSARFPHALLTPLGHTHTTGLRIARSPSDPSGSCRRRRSQISAAEGTQGRVFRGSISRLFFPALSTLRPACASRRCNSSLPISPRNGGELA